jgi:PAS domain S-box-containing protein
VVSIQFVNSDKPKVNWNELERLAAVDDYEILDTPKEEEFEDIVKLAAQICHVPISLISFVTTGRQWFKASHGLAVKETPLDVSICSHAILQNELFVVPDTTKDPRFQENPLVTGEPHLRFYAGALLETPEGLPLGTICVLDSEPRTLTETEASTLKALSRQVMTQLELRRALKAKSKSEERLALALNASGFIGIWDWDIQRDRVTADPRFVSIFGGDLDWNLQGVPIADYVKAIHPDDLPRVKEKIEQAMQADIIFQEEYRLLQKDGSVRWIEARGKCHFDKEGKPIRFPGVALDITDRKFSEQKAREAADRFRFMAESMPQKIFTAKPDGSVDFLNWQWGEFTGLTLDQIMNWGWTQFVHPHDVDENVRRWKEAVAQVKPFEIEHRFRRKDGAYHWHLSRAFPMRSAAGEVTMWIGSSTDIDDQRRASEMLEKTVVERTARLQESIAELEAFSYSISHDMRAPLRAMLGFSEILREEYGPQMDATANHYLDRIAMASKRMDVLIQDVLSFSQMSRLDLVLEPVDPNYLIHAIVESYPNLNSAEVEIVIPERLPLVMAHEAALTQCVSNILGNAVKFVGEGIKPHVRISAQQEKDRVKITFEDNGIGIAPENFERIFDIFHRLDRGQEGTGIGLAIVKKAAEKMAGEVGVNSAVGRGTSFWLELRAI